MAIKNEPVPFSASRFLPLSRFLPPFSASRFLPLKQYMDNGDFRKWGGRRKGCKE